MKIKLDFVTNSSSTAFIIANTSDEKRTLVDFVKENPDLIEEFVNQYDWHKGDDRYTQEKLIESASRCNIEWNPNEEKDVIFGDEDGTLIGEVFDYILRGGGVSKSFEWWFKEFHR